MIPNKDHTMVPNKDHTIEPLPLKDGSIDNTILILSFGLYNTIRYGTEWNQDLQ